MKKEKQFDQPEIQLDSRSSDRKSAKQGEAYLEREPYKRMVLLSVRLFMSGFKRAARPKLFKVRFGGEDIVYYRDDSQKGETVHLSVCRAGFPNFQ